MSKQNLQDFKVILVGDYSTGKSSIINRLCTDRFEEDYQVTTGVEFFSSIVDIQNNEVHLQIWDTVRGN